MLWQRELEAVMSPREAADRRALGDLVAAYARAVDRRDYRALAGLFLPDGTITIQRPGSATRVLDGPATIATSIRTAHAGLIATHHQVGQQLATVDDDDASMETYCVAQHLEEIDGVRWNRVMNIRYLDRACRTGGGWRFARRDLIVDWVERRPMLPPGPADPGRG